MLCLNIERSQHNYLFQNCKIRPNTKYVLKYLMLKTPTFFFLEYTDQTLKTLCHLKILHFQSADISLTIKCKERKPAQTTKFTLKLLQLQKSIFIWKKLLIFCLPLAKEQISQFPLPLVRNRNKLILLSLLNDF